MRVCCLFLLLALVTVACSGLEVGVERERCGSVVPTRSSFLGRVEGRDRPFDANRTGGSENWKTRVGSRGDSLGSA